MQFACNFFEINSSIYLIGVILYINVFYIILQNHGLKDHSDYKIKLSNIK